MSIDPSTTDSVIPANDVVSDADAETLEGRSRVALPPRTPDPAEALADQEAQTNAQPAPLQTYDEWKGLLPG